MIESVLDASAILAFLGDEPGAAEVESRLARSMLSSANLAEVVTKLIERGATNELALDTVGSLGCEIVPIDEGLGLRAGTLHRDTRARGLSLGERLCMVLAEREALPAVTADRAWASLPLPIEVILIR